MTKKTSSFMNTIHINFLEMSTIVYGNSLLTIIKNVKWRIILTCIILTQYSQIYLQCVLKKKIRLKFRVQLLFNNLKLS